MSRHFGRIVCLAALLMSLSAAAQTSSGGASQAFPDRTVRIILTTPPGSAGDFLARVVAQGLSETYRRQVVVENRPGAGGLIGAGAIRAAAPDGYTMGVASTAHLVAPMLQAQPPYRPIEDFTPIAQLSTLPSLLVVSANVPAHNIEELVRLAKSRPGRLNFASLGDGTAAHLAGVVFNKAAGIDVVHVPFKNASDVHAAIFSGDVQYLVFPIPSAMPMIKGGKARGLAVTSARRSPALPDTPSVVEAGLPAAVSDPMVGLVGPANMPPEVVAKLSADIVTVMRSPDVRVRFASQGGVPSVDTTPQAYGARLKAEYESYRELIAALKLKSR